MISFLLCLTQIWQLFKRSYRYPRRAFAAHLNLACGAATSSKVSALVLTTLSDSTMPTVWNGSRPKICLLTHSSKAELEEVESLLTKPGLVFYVRGELCPRELSSTEVASLLRRVQRACWLCVNCDVYDYRILDRLDYTMEELKNMSHCTLFRLRVAARARCCIPKDCFDEKRSHMDFPWTRWAAEHKTLRHNVQMVIDRCQVSQLDLSQCSLPYVLNRRHVLQECACPET